MLTVSPASKQRARKSTWCSALAEKLSWEQQAKGALKKNDKEDFRHQRSPDLRHPGRRQNTPPAKAHTCSRKVDAAAAAAAADDCLADLPAAAV